MNNTTPKRALRIVAAALLVAAAAGCRHNALPKGVMDSRQMADFLTEAYQIEGFFAVEQRYDLNTLAPEMVAAYDHLLDSLRLSRDEVERSLAYYAEHPDLYMHIHDTVVRRIDRTDPLRPADPQKFEMHPVQ